MSNTPKFEIVTDVPLPGKGTNGVDTIPAAMRQLRDAPAGASILFHAKRSAVLNTMTRLGGKRVFTSRVEGDGMRVWRLPDPAS